MSRAPTAGVVLLAFAFILWQLFPVAGTQAAFFLSIPSSLKAKIERQRIPLLFALSILPTFYPKTANVNPIASGRKQQFYINLLEGHVLASIARRFF